MQMKNMTDDEKKIAAIEARAVHDGGYVTLVDDDYKTLLTSRLAWKFTCKCFAEEGKENERLRLMLERAETILSNMAMENEGAIFNRWPINHEPLRADARNLVPLIREALTMG